MGYKVLTLSPGSTSTKVAVFDGTEALLRLNVTHPADELARFDSAADQFDYRRQTILDALAEQGIRLEDIDAFSGYCGAMGPTVGGIFAIDDTVCEHVMNAGVNHPAILMVGLCCGAGLRLAVYLKSKNAKKYRHGMEYGSARWSA